MSKWLLAVLWVFFAGAGAYAQDVVRMKNGDVYRGEILRQEFGKKVQILFKDGNEKSLSWDEIDSIEKDGATEKPKVEAPAPAPAPPPPVVANPEPAPAEPHHLWRAYFRPGMTVANSSSYTVKSSGGAQLSGTTDNGKASLLLGSELAYQFHPIFGITMVFDWSKYFYKDDTVADTELAFLMMPRAQAVFPNVTLWAGFGMGLGITSLGLFSKAIGTYTVTFDQSVSSFVMSPRIGADLPVSPTVSLGLELFYVFTSGEISGSILNRSNSQTAAFSEDVSRKWMGIVSKLGIAL